MSIRGISFFFVAAFMLVSCQEITTHTVYWNDDDASKKEQGEWIRVSTPEGLSKLQHGTWRSWYQDGQLQSEVHFEKGRKVGVARYWHPNGQLRQVIPYNDQGLPDGTVKWWNSKGKLLETSQMVDGTGIDYYFHTNGQVRARVKYVKGVPQGEPIHYPKTE